MISDGRTTFAQYNKKKGVLPLRDLVWYKVTIVWLELWLSI